MPETAVAARGLVKRYAASRRARDTARALGARVSDGVEAIRGIDFDVRQGEVFGVLGPNGAGKTTLMKVLSTVFLPDAGTLEVLGRDPVREPAPLRRRIGVVLGEYERSFHWRLTGRQNLRFFSGFYGLTGETARRRGAELLERVGLTSVADRPYFGYSTGMKHRLALARGLLPDPELLVLDEPTAGLDAASSEELGALVTEFAKGGRTVLYTTHRIAEAGRLCARVMILVDGRIVALESPEALLARWEEDEVVEVTTERAEALARDLRDTPGVRRADARGDRLLVVAKRSAAVPAQISETLTASGDVPRLFTRREPTVEDVYKEIASRPKGYRLGREEEPKEGGTT